MKIEFDKSKKIGVGLSGGADSMVLMHLLIEAGADVVAINIEHGIRGASSVADTEFVKSFCRERGIKCLAFGLDVPQYAEANGLSTETAARILRYEVFDKLLAERQVDVIATAHHADDLAETILMRLGRGTGVRGLRGIVNRAGYIRPLLKYSKEDILAYAAKNNISYCIDETNADIEYNRNFIRNKVLPLLKVRYPAFVENCARSAESLAEAEDFMLSEVSPFEVSDGVAKLPLSAFERHPAIAKKSVAECLRGGMGLVKDVEQRHLEAVTALAGAKNGTKIDLPFGVVALKEENDLAFYIPQTNCLAELPVELNKAYKFGSYSYKIKAIDRLVPHLTFDFEKLPAGAVIRTRREGDLFKRYGGGTKPLAEYLTDIKYPKYLREGLPVIAAGNTVYVVMGVEVGEAVKVDKATRNMVQIIYNKTTKE